MAKKLTEQMKIFCHNYVIDWNGTRVAKIAYPKIKSDNVAASTASRLLRNVKIIAYIEELKSKIEELAGVSKLSQVLEYKKIAYSNMANFHKTWITRKEFELLTDDEAACIKKIKTKKYEQNIGKKGSPNIVTIEEIQIELHDKNKALENIDKKFDYNTTQKVDVTSKGEKLEGNTTVNITIANRDAKSFSELMRKRNE